MRLAVARRALRPLRSPLERSLLLINRARLRLSGKDRFARAINGRQCPLAPAIEQWRAEKLADDSPLSDGTLEAGPYDEGTVSAAAQVSRAGAGARVLYSLAAEFRPRTILELGTNIGISSAYIASAGGQVTTLEASAYRLRLARQLHDRLGLRNVTYVRGLFTDTLADLLRQHPPIDMAFIDGHHQYEPTLDYFATISEYASPDCVYVFDDIRYSPGMWRAWSELRRKFETTADLGGMGIGTSQEQ